MSRIKNDDDPILRDGESLRVSMIMMDSVQRAIADYEGEFGAMGKNFPTSIDVPNPPMGPLAPHVGGDPGDPRSTRTASQNKGPAMSKAQAEAEEAYATRSLELGGMWKTKQEGFQ